MINRLLKNSSHVIARSSFCDKAISNPLILLKARLPRFTRNDRKKTFSTACQGQTPMTSLQKSDINIQTILSEFGKKNG